MRKFAGLVAVCVVALAACAQEEKSPAQQQIDDERAIAEVEAAQTPPPDVVAPERITPEERTRFGLSDRGCAFAVNNPEVGAQAILQMNVGYLKFDGRMERFAPDAGSGGGPSGTSTRYDGGRHGIHVQYDMAAAQQTASEQLSVPTRITLQDGRGRIVYVADGIALCG
ncbi:hypothetical protein [Qipengyuania sediminis]|uniref:hypothetical protein n=1 Tax=Qipengyuania sediminis TaxID=1532023 RepID=UPI00105A18F6|nr:hypothetical protein [Qipengyuania sediminis]